MSFLPDGSEQLVNAVLMMFTGDFPATTKALGFSSLTSRSGCTKCSRVWNTVPGSGNRPYTATFDLPLEYQTKNRTNHIYYGDMWLEANLAERTKLVSDFGYRYTSFTSEKLPYFVPGLLHAVDSMHCLLLGLFKALFVQCSNEGIFSGGKFQSMQQLCDSVKLPQEMDGIRLKIDSHMKSLKAAQV